MPIFAAAGSKFYIGSAPMDDKNTDFVETDFDAVSWIEVTPLETIGTVGDEAESVDFNSLGNNRRKRMKGVRAAPNLEISAGLDYSDSGQAKVLEAEASNHNYPVRVVFNDAPATGAAPTPSERKMIGMVMSVGETVDSANSVLRLNANIAINSNVVRLNAATGD